jgi:predicted N-acetyltransferase YhbS
MDYVEVLNIFQDKIFSKYREQGYVTHFKNDSGMFSILIMEGHGKAFGRVYWYFDEVGVVYLDSLSVDTQSRNEGLGKKVINIQEEIGKLVGASYLCLWVKKGTWMEDWYKRKGYKTLEDYEDAENAVWMKKEVNGI